MAQAIGKYTRAYEVRLALRFEPASPRELSAEAAAAEHTAMLDRMLARAAQLHGWPDGKPPPARPVQRSTPLMWAEMPKADAA